MLATRDERATGRAARDLRGFMASLEAHHLLSRVRREVDGHLEVGAAMYQVQQKAGPAVLFERVKDTPYPLLCGAVALKAQLAEMGVPGVRDVWFRGRCFMAIVSLERQYYSGHARQAIDAGFARAKGFKWVVVVDDDIDVFDWEQVDWALSTRVQPHRDIVLTDDRRRGSGLDPSVPPEMRISAVDCRSSKIGIDATTMYKGFPWPPAVQPDPEMLDKVRAQWAEYGID